MKSKKGVIAIVAVAVLTAAAVVGILIKKDYGSYRYNSELYFFNETATSIVMENREIKYKDDKELAESVIEALMKGPDNSRYMKIIEKNTKLLSLNDVDSGNIVVNFSGEFLTGDNTKDVLAVYAVVKSLCAISGVDSVKVIVEGKDIATADGSIIGYLRNQDINLSTDTYNSETREIALYFPNKDGNKLVMETRTIKVTDQQPLAQYIINELIKGPENKELSVKEIMEELGLNHRPTFRTNYLHPALNELSVPLSKDTVLLSVETSDNICFVNFKANFTDKNSGTAEKEKMTIYSIVDSLTELDNIQRVQFLMDGKKVDNFGNINIGSMFGRDGSIIAE